MHDQKRKRYKCVINTKSREHKFEIIRKIFKTCTLKTSHKNVS